MKPYLFILLMLSASAGAQSIALLDREFKNGITVTETLTRNRFSGKIFPIYTADLDVVIQLTERLAHAMANGTRQPSNLLMLPAGHSSLTVITQGSGMQTTYSVSLSTRSGNVGTFLQLVHQSQGNRKAVQALLLFLDYLKNNRHLVGPIGDKGA